MRNKVLGGVCSGIGNYLNIDPVFLRGLLLIAVFIFGSGVLIYLLLWIAMPQAKPGELPEFNENRNKRLFRNEEDKMLGGVCAGAGNYFGIDPVWLRLLFLVALFFYGSGVLLYVVLWAIIPKAVTVAQKLQMKGEPVDVNNIERVIRNTFGNNNPQPSGFLNNLVSMFGQLFKFMLSAAGKLIGLVLVFFALTLFALWMASTFYYNEQYDAFVRLFTLTHEVELYARWGVCFLLLSIICGLTFLAYRLLFSTRLKLRYAGLVSTVLSVAGIVLITIASVKYSLQINRGQHVIDRSYVYPVSDTMYFEMRPFDADQRGVSLKIDDEHVEIHNRRDDHDAFDLVFTNDTNKVLFNAGSLFIKPSLTDSIEIKIKKEARGRNVEEAQKIASDIKYAISAEGNRLILDRGILLDTRYGYRFQEVHTTMSIPVGTVLVMKRKVVNMMRGLDYDMWKGRMFKVTQDGLVCLDCKDDKTDIEHEDEGIHIEINEDEDDDHEKHGNNAEKGVRVIIKSNEGRDSVVQLTKKRQKIGPITIETEKTERKK
jgi:phage shock protein PspC (stress-responsive transcriptional regulator)